MSAPLAFLVAFLGGFDGSDVGFLLGFYVVLGLVHFLPSLLGLIRQKSDILLTVAINLLAGWSIIGWFVALYLALRSKTTTISPPLVVGPPAASVADELGKLRDLREQGILTEQEFERQKAHLLGSA